MSRMRDLLIKRRSEVTPLIHWDFSGKSNADAGTIVEDLTGNGYNLELKNFAFDNESGYNGYPTDFRKWNISDGISHDTTIVPEVYENKLIIKGILKDGASVAIKTEGLKEFQTNSCVIKVSGLPSNRYGRFYNYGSIASPGYVILHNGINIVDTSFNETASSKTCSLGYYGGTIGDILDVTFEIFPLYPDQLVFNGIDNFCQCTKDFVLPISRGYTWIIKYKNLNEKYLYLIGKGASSYSNTLQVTKQVLLAPEIYSYNKKTNISSIKDGITYGTSKFIDGPITLTKGTVDDNMNNKLVLGTLRPTEPSKYFNGTISEFYLFDRDLTQSQIEKFISDNMIPLPQVYYDVEKQGTLNEHTTKDKLIDFSGNENHGTLHNFTFDESNGWKEGYIQFNADSGTYITLDTLTSGFKTVCILFAPGIYNETHYDQRVVAEGSANPLAQTFAIYNEATAPAWNARNSGITYINGVLNTNIFSTSLSYVKHSAIIVNNDVTEDNTTTPAIGKGFIATNQHYSNMKFYKFLGFKEALSEKQIKMVIEKYNLNV